MVTLTDPAPTMDVPASSAVRIIRKVSLLSGSMSFISTTVNLPCSSPGLIWTSPEDGSLSKTKSLPGMASPDDEILLRESGFVEIYIVYIYLICNFQVNVYGFLFWFFF